MVTYNAEEKGEPITVIGGKYLGLKGWYWHGKSNTPKQVYVILKEEDGKEEMGVRVNKENVVSRGVPTNYIDAALQQYPDIAHDMKQLCKKLAMCKIAGDEHELQDKIYETVQAERAQLAERCNKYKVHYKVPAADDAASSRKRANSKMQE